MVVLLYQDQYNHDQPHSRQCCLTATTSECAPRQACVVEHEKVEATIFLMRGCALPRQVEADGDKVLEDSDNSSMFLIEMSHR